MHYTISMPQPNTHRFHIELKATIFGKDSLSLKMPNWMPGYYQIMNYAEAVENITAQDTSGNSIPLIKTNSYSWRIIGIKNKPILLTYDVKADRQFVANSYLDSTHAYFLPVSNCLYIDGLLKCTYNP